ncbi:MAG: hypothetical protein V2I97_17640 [Desulfococcaceae bacterium]|nr:hypothetical protein [Desulfococcaceae bacterium]
MRLVELLIEEEKNRAYLRKKYMPRSCNRKERGEVDNEVTEVEVSEQCDNERKIK